MNKGVLFLLVLILFSGLTFAGELKVTNEHPFLIKNEWIPAKQLVVGDLIQTYNGKARITKIEKIEENIPVYNLEDSYYHNYVVGDDNLIVHNSFFRNVFTNVYGLLIRYGQATGIYETVIGDVFVVQRTRLSNVKELHFSPGKLNDVSSLISDAAAYLIRDGRGKLFEGVSFSPKAEQAFNLVKRKIIQMGHGDDFIFEASNLEVSPSKIDSYAYRAGQWMKVYPSAQKLKSFKIRHKDYNPEIFAADTEYLSARTKFLAGVGVGYGAEACLAIYGIKYIQLIFNENTVGFLSTFN